MDRYEIIQDIIEKWFSFELELCLTDIMPHLIFLFEENKQLKEMIDNPENFCN